MSASDPQILVAGASGHLGRRVLEILLEQGANVSAATRTPEKLASFSSEEGLEVRRADFDRPETLNDAFDGIDRLLLVSTDELSTPGRRVRQHEAAIRAAVAAGVKHIVYTSMPDPSPGSPVPFAPDHLATEKMLEESGIGYTVLRVAWYAENLLGLLPEVLAAGKWYTSAGDGRIPYVPREDVARATAAALTSDVEGRRVLDLSGKEALAISQLAALAKAVFEKPIEVVQVDDEELSVRLAEIGVAPHLVPMWVATDANTRLGRFDVVTSLVEDLTGTAPKSVRDYLIENRAAFLAR